MSLDNVAYVVKNSPYWFMWETLSRYEDVTRAKFLNAYARGESKPWSFYKECGFTIVQVRLNFEEIKRVSK